MINEERKDGETLDEYIERLIKEEKAQNEIDERRAKIQEVRRLQEMEEYWNRWSRWSGTPLGKKLSAKRKKFFQKYMDASAGNWTGYS